MGLTHFFGFLVTFYQETEIFYRKPKWSVWSIGTFFYEMGLEISDEKRSYGRKVKILGRSKNSKISSEVPKSTFGNVFKTKNIFKNTSFGIFPGHSGLILYQNYIIFQGTSLKNNKSVTSMPFGGPTCIRFERPTGRQRWDGPCHGWSCAFGRRDVKFQTGSYLRMISIPQIGLFLENQYFNT